MKYVLTNPIGRYILLYLWFWNNFVTAYLVANCTYTRYKILQKGKKLIKYYKVRYSCHFVTQINKNTVTLNCRLEQLLQDFTRKK